MERITEKMLEAGVKRLNALANQPSATHEKDENGQYHSNIGNYHLYFAYGRVGLHQTLSTGGGVRQILGLGTKRELYNELHAYIDGFSAATTS